MGWFGLPKYKLRRVGLFIFILGVIIALLPTSIVRLNIARELGFVLMVIGLIIIAVNG